MTFATVAASGTPKATPPQDVRPARSILRPLPEGDAFSDHAAPGRHRLESMTSTSSSGSELVGTEAANFSGYVRQSAARHYPTGLGPVRLVHVCRDEDQREVVLVAVQRDGLALEDASAELKADRDPRIRPRGWRSSPLSTAVVRARPRGAVA